MTEQATRPDTDGDLLDTRQVADLTPYEASTLKKWRMTWPDGQRIGPRFVRVGSRKIRYRRSEVEQWLRSQAQDV